MDRIRKRRRTAGWVATVLVIAGALNWLMVGLFGIDIVAGTFGAMSTLSRMVYILVGISGLYMIYFARRVVRHTHDLEAAAHAT